MSFTKQNWRSSIDHGVRSYVLPMLRHVLFFSTNKAVAQVLHAYLQFPYAKRASNVSTNNWEYWKCTSMSGTDYSTMYSFFQSQ